MLCNYDLHLHKVRGNGSGEEEINMAAYVSIAATREASDRR